MILLEVITARYQHIDGLHREQLAGRHVPAHQLRQLVVEEDGVDVGVREVTVEPRLELGEIEGGAEQQHGVPGRAVADQGQAAQLQQQLHLLPLRPGGGEI